MKSKRRRYNKQRGGGIPIAACAPCMGAVASNPIAAAIAIPVAGASYVGYKMCGKKRKKKIKQSFKQFIKRFSVTKKGSSKKKKSSKKN